MSEPLKFDLHLLNKYIKLDVCNIIVNEKKNEQVMDLNFWLIEKSKKTSWPDLDFTLTYRLWKNA